jgi:hypothetical protein
MADVGAGLKSLVGGEIKSMSKLTRDLRSEVIADACEQVILSITKIQV